MKNSLYLQLLYSIILLSLSHYTTAWPWPALLPPIDTIWARQENGNTDNIPAAQASSNSLPMPTDNQGQTAQETQSVVTSGTLSMPPKVTDGANKGGNQSESETVSGSTSFDARLPAGGVSMQTPAISLGQQYFKIGDYVTFGWNYTSLEATPTAVNIMATCTANKQLYTIQMNQTVANNTGLVVWDTGSYQATAVQNPLLTQTYTLIIYDSDSGPSATAQPGYLAVYNQYTFGMYSPQPYTPLGDFRCVTCSGGISDQKRNALGMVFGMSIITILSFSFYARRLGVVW